MYQKTQTIYDLNPDGVKVIVDWDKMCVGASVFVPCVNTVRAAEQARKVAQLKSWRMTIRARVENKMFGVRMWRTV